MSTEKHPIVSDAPTESDALLEPHEAAAVLKIRPRGLAPLRKKGLPYVRLGHRTIRYRPAAIAQWAKEQEEAA